jgi:hypothetical protein
VAVNDNWAYGISNVTTGSTTNVGTFVYPAVTNGVTYISSGGTGSWSAPEPKPQSALEWLDAEVEKTCALARLTPAA